MDAVGVQSFFDKRDDAIELADSVASYVASGNNFHAVELPDVEVVNVLDAIDELYLFKQGIRVDVFRNKLHHYFGNANELRDG